MRGREDEQGTMLLGITPDALVPKDHPIRRIREITHRALNEMNPVLNTMYSGIGRPSVAPERLLKASILMALYSIRSERQFCERLQYDLLFKWFLNMNIAAPAFDHASFSKNRERLIKHQVAEQFFAAVMAEATKARLISDDHFTVDGTLLQAWASLKSVKPRDDDQRGHLAACATKPPAHALDGGRKVSVVVRIDEGFTIAGDRSDHALRPRHQKPRRLKRAPVETRLDRRESLGTRVVKHRGEPRTGHQRLFEGGALSEFQRRRFDARLRATNPAELQRQLAKVLRRPWRLGRQETKSAEDAGQHPV